MLGGASTTSLSDRFIGRVKDARILSNVFGSDHCPVMIEVE